MNARHGRFVAAASAVIALAMSAWVIRDSPHASAGDSAADAQAVPQVEYFPSRYVNQAKQVEEQPPSF